ncbi:MAG TPA: DUF5615 family PIN-like protein [Herpetosiphonaceae bacterium]
MKLLIDMNLPPAWVEWLERSGWHTAHWSSIGDPRATDRVLMDYARLNGYVIITHDLDFGTILAVTRAEGPSVLQIRTQDLLSTHVQTLIVAALHQFAELLETGALITIDEHTSRARILPIRR